MIGKDVILENLLKKLVCRIFDLAVRDVPFKIYWYINIFPTTKIWGLIK